MKKKIVSVDWDNVLYNLEDVNTQFVAQHYGDIITTMDVNDWEFYGQNYPEVIKIWGDWAKYSTGSFFPGDIEFIKTLQEKYEVQIVTASYKEIADEKDIVAYQRYGDIRVIHSHGGKSQYTANSILIDDAMHNIDDHIAVNKMPAILVDRGYGWNQSYQESALVKRAFCFESILTSLRHFNH